MERLKETEAEVNTSDNETGPSSRQTTNIVSFTNFHNCSEAILAAPSIAMFSPFILSVQNSEYFIAS